MSGAVPSRDHKRLAKKEDVDLEPVAVDLFSPHITELVSVGSATTVTCCGTQCLMPVIDG